MTLRDVRRAMKAMRDSPMRTTWCPPHIVRPPRPGFVWEAVDDLDDPDAEVIRCSSLCGFAMLARPVRAIG